MTPALQTLADFVDRTPGAAFLSAEEGPGGWWAKLHIDIAHPLAWHVVQEYGHVLNQLSLEQPLPTTFKPVSPPPYMNGGPEDFLSWVVECADPHFPPDKAAEWLEGRLPRPVDDPDSWDEEG